ncbi:MAG TPA: polymer-forming cytoskeletal protein [Candidatus Methanomethylicus sp.]|nr:polymer-forming cytoskeletal protein [Candidatus Methanomethylicus sp.]
MKIENRKMNGDFKVSEELTLNGTVGGSTIVADKGFLVLNGVISQDLILEKGSKAEICGAVNGNVYNKGGELRIKGVVNGSIYKDAGLIIIETDAKLNGKIY